MAERRALGAGYPLGAAPDAWSAAPVVLRSRAGPRRGLVALVREPAGAAGVVLTLGVVLLALGAGWIRPGDPLQPVAPPLQPPGPAFPMGTDDLGRDVLAGVLHGARTSLVIGAAVALASALVGSLIGSGAGLVGGRVDDALMRASELFQVVPRFFLALVTAALFGASVPLVTLLLALTFWPGTARIVRSQVLSLREREFVVAARALGAGTGRVLLRHVLPNAVAAVLVTSALQVGAAILVEASLGYLGLGDRRLASWGYMLGTAQPFLRSAPWLALCPGGALVLTVVGVNLLADGLTAALDPRLQPGRRGSRAW